MTQNLKLNTFKDLQDRGNEI